MNARVHIIAVAALAVLAGCIVPVPKGPNPLELKLMTVEGLREYSEEVFRRHNRVISRLMMAPLEIESLSSAQATRLDRAERRAVDACSALNEVASMRASGEDTDFGLENEVRRTVRQCNAETKALERLLDQLQISA